MMYVISEDHHNELQRLVEKIDFALDISSGTPVAKEFRTSIESFHAFLLGLQAPIAAVVQQAEHCQRERLLPASRGSLRVVKARTSGAENKRNAAANGGSKHGK